MDFHTSMVEKYGAWDGWSYVPKRRYTTKLVLDVGINDVEFLTQPKDTNTGKQIRHPGYVIWKNMLERVLSPTTKSLTYKGATILEDWLSLSHYLIDVGKIWYRGCNIDKDLLVKGNMLYSKDTCLAIPRALNTWLTDSKLSRGEHPLGVDFAKVSGKFRARIRDKASKAADGSISLGYYTDPMEAHKAWQKHKLLQAYKWKELGAPLDRIIKQLEYEISNGLETITLTH